MQRLSVRLHSRLHIFREVGIGHWLVAELLLIRLRQSNALADLPARILWRPDNRHGQVVMLHDHLDTVLDPDQHSMDIAGEFGSRDADRRHHLNIEDSFYCTLTVTNFGGATGLSPTPMSGFTVHFWTVRFTRFVCDCSDMTIKAIAIPIRIKLLGSGAALLAG
jgi:hypothetical protein